MIIAPPTPTPTPTPIAVASELPLDELEGVEVAAAPVLAEKANVVCAPVDFGDFEEVVEGVALGFGYVPVSPMTVNV